MGVGGYYLGDWRRTVTLTPRGVHRGRLRRTGTQPQTDPFGDSSENRLSSLKEVIAQLLRLLGKQSKVRANSTGAPSA